MIKSTIQLLYDARNGQKQAIIEMEVKNWETGPEGVKYFVRDYAVNGTVRELINEKEVFYFWDQINSLNEYIESINTYTGLSKKELEYTKIQHALLIETKTNPVYCSTAENWVLTENNLI